MAEHGKRQVLATGEEQALRTFLESQNSDMLRIGLPPVSTATALKFLMARKFDVTRAKKLFKRHLEVRLKYKMADIKPLDEPLSKELLSEKFTILERCKENKAAIMLINGKHYRPEKNSNDNTTVIQSLIFQLDEALLDTSTQRHGLILLYNMTDSGRHNFNYSLSVEILNLLKDAYPARLKKILIISAPMWFKVSFKIIATFLDEKIRDRVQFSDLEGIKEHLEPECIPCELGGEWNVNHILWMTRCIESYKDGNCDEPCLQITQPLEGRMEVNFGAENRASPEPSSDIPTDISPRNEKPVHGLTVQQLLAHMQEKGPQGLRKEFDTMETYDRESTHDVFKFPYNRLKNRYVDVICLDDSRIHIPIIDGDEATDYIHANYVDGYYGKNTYIAAQGPLPATFNDFWRMVWATKTVVIVMLTKEIQRGRVKCGRYWPVKGAFELYQDIEICCVEETEEDDFIIRVLVLTDTETKESRTVNQIQIISWPDFGVPDSSEPIFQLKTMVEKLQSEASGSEELQTSDRTMRPPVVVHCSAGIGRTGSYCTISIGIDSLLDTGHCDVVNTVKRIREQRAQSVQTADQYELCYTSLLEYAALHVTSIAPQEKIEILEFLNGWKTKEELTW